jgi:diguanylate cyclase (GGDEF)-like protein
MCNNSKLRSGCFDEWDFINPKIGKRFMIKDTLVNWNGRKCRLEIAIDITSQDQQHHLSQDNINSEALVNEGLRRSLATSSPSKSIEILIEYIGQALHSDRCYIFEEKTKDLFDNTYEWCAPGVEPQIQNLQNFPREGAAIWLERFQRGHNVIIKNLEDTKESDPLMYEYLLPQDIHSLVVSPLVYENHIIGFYGVDNPPASLLDNISTLFMIMGHFIVSLIRRRDLFRQLEKLSYYDELTGFGNRHLLENHFSNLDPNDSIGLLYCDVTGLKRINDTLGHKAGDDLILRACDSLTTVFPEYGRFRLGGDEFLVFCEGIGQDELHQRIERLKETTCQKDVVLAIGSVWRPDSHEDIDRLLSQADEAMYQDKREYYKKNDRRK